MESKLYSGVDITFSLYQESLFFLEVPFRFWSDIVKSIMEFLYSGVTIVSYKSTTKRGFFINRGIIYRVSTYAFYFVS